MVRLRGELRGMVRASGALVVGGACPRAPVRGGVVRGASWQPLAALARGAAAARLSKSWPRYGMLWALKRASLIRSVGRLDVSTRADALLGAEAFRAA
jgi:hypothetical protein